MADNEMDSWDEEEEKEWQKQRARGYNEEKSLHKNQYSGAMWYLMIFQIWPLQPVMRRLKFLLTLFYWCLKSTKIKASYRKEQQRRAASDLRKYRNNYPDRPKVYLSQGGTLPEMQNLEFYLNKKRFKPNGELIEVILEEWKNNYELLERNHSYIQWLFPLQEQGVNYRARMLTKTEIEMMKKDKEVQRRFLEAYKLMLGFYGIKLVSEATGEVERAEKFEERFDNLDYHSHNNLRITRILKCLGELGFEHYQAPLVKFFLVETLVEKQLQGVKNSVLDYFMFTVKDKQQRRDLVHFAWENYEPRQKFIWGPIEKLKKYKKSSECDSDVGREKGGKENMAKTQEAEERCGEHGDGKHQVGDDIKIEHGMERDIKTQKAEKLYEEQNVSNEPNSKNGEESQGEQRPLDQSAVGSGGRGDEKKEHSKREDSKDGNGSSDGNEDALLGTSDCGTDNNTQLEGSSVDEDNKKTECIEQKVESPRRLEEDNVTEVTQLKAETECERTSSKKESESLDDSDFAAGGAECQNQENENDEEETNLSNEEKPENYGGLDNDDKIPGPNMDGRKRKMKGGRTDDLTQTASTSDEELANKMTENCTIIQMHPVKTERTDDKDEAKKVKLECNSNGDSGNGERFLGSDPKESAVLLGAKEPPHQMNVKQDPLQDKAEGNQTNSYL